MHILAEIYIRHSAKQSQSLRFGKGVDVSLLVLVFL